MRISDWSSDVCSSDLTVITVVQAPPGATRERTEEAVRQVKEFYNQQDIVTSVFVVRGFSFFGQGQANGMMFTMLKPWEERSGERSEEHTSGTPVTNAHLVCRLLLEKKKKKKVTKHREL